MWSYMQVFCPICRQEMDGMRGYGRDNVNCCSKECYQEWEWRRTLAILEREYEPDPRKLPLCDSCGERHKDITDKCDMVWGRRGFRQLGNYDG